MIKNYLTVLVCLLLTLDFYAATKYVDAANGNDNYNGNSSFVGSFPNGPKATIMSALNSAQENDNIVIKTGQYTETVTITKNFNFIVNSQVSIKTIVLNSKDKSLNMIGPKLLITDSLVLNYGKIDVSTGLELHLKDNCVVIGGNNNSFVDGPLFIEKKSMSNSALYFPIGNDKDFRPITLNLSQQAPNLNIFVARLNKGAVNYADAANSINRISKVHYWTINKIGSTAATNITLGINYDSAFTDDEVNNSENLVIGCDSANNMNNMGGTGTNNFTGEIVANMAREEWGNFTLCNKIGGINSLGHTAPFAQYGFKGTCVNKPYKFTDSTYTTDDIVNWKWEFDNNNPGVHVSTLRNPEFTFTGVGPHLVKLVVTNSLGEKDSMAKFIKPNKLPTPNFSINNSCIGDSTFTKNLTSPSDSIKDWLWEVNGSTFIDKELKLKINKTDTTLVHLIATNLYGCSDTVSKKVVLYNKPNPSFSFTNICFGDTTKFFNNSAIRNDTILKNQWYLDNSLIHTKKNFESKFSSYGPKKFTLICESANNCIDSITKTITISKSPEVSFDLANSINNGYSQCISTNNFELINSSKSNSTGAVTYDWSTSNNDKSNLKNPAFTFANAGEYYIKLIVKNSSKCSDSLEKKVVVLPKPSVTFSDKIPCFPDSLILYPNASAPNDSIVSYEWNMGNGTIINSKDSFKYEYPTKGSYKVNFKITTKNGCQDSFSKLLAIFDKPDAKISTSGSTAICEGDSILLTATGANSYVWLNNNSQNNSIFVKQSGSYILQGASTNNCFGYDTINVTVNALPVANAGYDMEITRGKTVTLSGLGGQQYLWVPSTYLDYDNIGNPTAKPTKSITYTLNVTDANGCEDSDEVDITVVEPDNIQIVNLLSPNGDGQNDFWDLSDLPELNTCNVSVFNRNGVLVFHTTDYQNDWDGTWEGNPLPEGNYFYYIHCDSEKEDFKGSIIILR